MLNQAGIICLPRFIEHSAARILADARTQAPNSPRPLWLLPRPQRLRERDGQLLWHNALGTASVEGAGDYFLNGEVRRRLSLNQQWQLGQNLGLRLSALYYNGKGNGAVGTGANATAYGFTNTANTNRLTSIGALYTTGPWTMSAGLFDGKIPSGAQVPASVGMAAGSTHTTATALALSYKLSPEFTLSGGHYILKDKTNSGNKASQTAISLDYNMFKDTVVYAQAASTSNTGSNMNLSPVFGTPVTAGKSNTATMVGVRYTF